MPSPTSRCCAAPVPAACGRSSKRLLLNTMYELPGRTDVGKVVIDADTVRERTNPTLVPRKSSSSRPRRAAS